MKSFLIFALALVLTAALLVGCGCTNRNMDNTSAPTVLPTNEELWNTTEPTTRATTEHTTVPTTETVTRSTDNTTDSTGTTAATENGMESRARRMMPGSR